MAPGLTRPGGGRTVGAEPAMTRALPPQNRGPSGVYLPEIHDLAPGMAARLDRMVEAFPPAARERLAWLAVPDWQGTQPLDAAPAFAARLRALPGTPVLHGWTRSRGPDLMNWLLYGHDDRSEFAGLSRAETEARVARGREMLARALGRAPEWFCAPRWRGNPHLDAALAEAGFRGVMTVSGLVRFGRGRTALPALNFDEGARGFRIRPALALRALAIRRLLASRRPFRLVLHPDDLGRPAVIAQFRALASRLEAEGWRPVGLDEAAALGKRGA